MLEQNINNFLLFVLVLAILYFINCNFIENFTGTSSNNYLIKFIGEDKYLGVRFDNPNNYFNWTTIKNNAQKFKDVNSYINSVETGCFSFKSKANGQNKMMVDSCNATQIKLNSNGKISYTNDSETKYLNWILKWTGNSDNGILFERVYV